MTSRTKTQPDISVADLLDGLEAPKPKPYKVERMSQKTRDAVLRALARGVPAQTISNKLRGTPEFVDAKPLRAWMRTPEIAAIIEKMKEQA
jgi:hypothetical protein